MTVNNEDTLAGVVLIALAVVVTWMSLDMGTGAAGATLKPNFFPLICAAGIGLCGAAMATRGLLSGHGGIPKLVDRRFAIVAALIVVDFWWFAQIDFRVGAFVVTLVTMLAFGVRKPLLLALYPPLLTAVLYLGFTRGFDVVLPTWN